MENGQNVYRHEANGLGEVEADEPIDRVSGRWLRDQLRDVAADSGPAPSAGGSTNQVLEGLAQSISRAVVEPIRDLESRREDRQRRVEESIERLSEKLGEAHLETGRVRDRLGVVAGETAGLTQALETLRTEQRRDSEHLSAAQVELRDALSAARGELAALRERLREQESLIARLHERDGRRARAFAEMATAIEGFRGALSAVADESGA